MGTFLGNLLYRWENSKTKWISAYLQRYYYENIGKIGDDVRFNGINKFTGMDRIEIGNNVHFAGGAYVRAEGGLMIGDNCHISRNFVLYTHSHNFMGTAIPYDHTFRFKSVTIEQNVWIGMNVTVVPGTHIKHGAIIGAGSVVHGTIEALSIVGAPPPAVIKYREEQHYQSLVEEGQFGGINGKLYLKK
jgi:acetyltransferase-like isoleucine patch superfamily enzyme